VNRRRLSHETVWWILGSGASAFVAVVGLLPSLNDSWETSGALLLLVAAVVAGAVAFAASQVAHLKSPTQSARTDNGKPAEQALEPQRWGRLTAGCVTAVGILILGTFFPRQESPERSYEDGPELSGEATEDPATEAPNGQIADEEALPQHLNDNVTVCPRLTSVWTAGVADELDTGLLRPGSQIASIQRSALPSVPELIGYVEKFTILTYAGSDWLIRVVIDCTESVVAYSVTTADPATFSPTLPPCIQIEGGVGSIWLPALYQRDLIWIQGGGTSVPPSYAEIQRLGTAAGCRGSSAFMLGSVIAADLGFDRWLPPGDVAGYAPIVGTDDRLVVEDPEGGLPPKMCARASTYGEFGIDPEKVEIGWLMPFWRSVWELTEGSVPEDYGAEVC
jgi:hypothetical protein